MNQTELFIYCDNENLAPPISLIVIADRISKEENDLAFPFGDRHHLYLRKLIHTIFPSNSTYWTYLVKEFIDTRKTITLGLAKKHLITVLDEIIQWKPKVILTIGRISSRLLSQDLTKPLLKGQVHDTGKTLVASWSSANVLFNSGKDEEKAFIQFLNDLKTHSH